MTHGSTLLVTGARGNIGRRVRALVDAMGLEASYAWRLDAGAVADDAAAQDPAVDLVDITDTQALEEVVVRRRPDAIIHLASITGAACEAAPERAVAVNVEAVRSLADIAQANGVARIVLASTAAVYGDQFHAQVGGGSADA